MRRCLPGAVLLLVSITGFAACSTEERTFGGARGGEGGEPGSASGGNSARGGTVGDAGSTAEEAGRPASSRGGSTGSGGSQTSDAGEDGTGIGGEVSAGAGGSSEGGTNGAGTGNAGRGGTLNPGAGGSGGTLSGGSGGKLGSGGKTSGGSSNGGTSSGGTTGVGGSKGGTTSLGGTPGVGGTPTFGGLTGSGGAGTIDICEAQKPIKGAPTPRCSDKTTIANGGGTLLQQTYYLSHSNCSGYFNGAATVFVSAKQYYLRFWIEYRTDISIEGTVSSGTLLLEPGVRGTITVTEMCDRRTKGTVQTGTYEQSSNSLILTFPDNQLVWLIPS